MDQRHPGFCITTVSPALTGGLTPKIALTGIARRARDEHLLEDGLSPNGNLGWGDRAKDAAPPGALVAGEEVHRVDARPLGRRRGATAPSREPRQGWQSS